MESALSTVLDNCSWATAILALAVCVIFYLYIQWIHMPPGPTGLPYLGYYPFLRSDFHVQLQDLEKKYGDVFCIRCTGQTFLYLGSVQALREAHVTKADCFTGRPTIKHSVWKDALSGGIAFLSGEDWKDMRNFFVPRLREFGLGKKTQESLMTDFLERTVATIRKTDGENFDALPYFTYTCTKIIYAMLLSGSKTDDDDIARFNEAYAIVTEAMVGSKALLTGPLFGLMMHLHPEYRSYRKSKILVDDILTKMIKEHEKDFDKHNIRDLVDCYISMRRELEEKGDPKCKLYTVKCLVNTLMQFIGDGGFSIGFLIAVLLKELRARPEIQKEIQREIDNVVGRSRFPSWDDKSRMPYISAVIQECFRTIVFFPVFPSLECTKETTVCGCRVPKGAVTLAGYWAAFHDPDLYQEPEKFDPTRFLPSDDEQKPKSQLPVFFGVGKRTCVGETLVVMETFLFIATVLQNFDLHPPKESESGASDSSPKKTEIEQRSSVLRATPRAS